MTLQRAIPLRLLLGFCLLAQLACSQLKLSQPKPEPSPDQTAVINEIFERYIQAMGGRPAIEALKSYQMRGTFKVSVMREGGTFETWGKDPNKTFSVIEFPHVGTLKKGYDGETRWVQTPLGTATTKDESPTAMAELERDSDIYEAGGLARLYKTLRLEMKARLNGHDVYVVEGKPEQGPAEKMYFNTENGLLERWDIARRRSGRGTVFVKVHLEDYREVDGIKIPFSVRFAFESFDLVMKLDEVKHNVPIDDAVFRRPTS